MSGLRVVPTWRHGQERLYVCLTDGRNIAWYDREAARINLLSEDRREDVLDALGPFLTGPVAVGPPPVPTPRNWPGSPSTRTTTSRPTGPARPSRSTWTGTPAPRT